MRLFFFRANERKDHVRRFRESVAGRAKKLDQCESGYRGLQLDIPRLRFGNVKSY